MGQEADCTSRLGSEHSGPEHGPILHVPPHGAVHHWNRAQSTTAGARFSRIQDRVGTMTTA